jgi:hypothetical protein
MNTGTRRFGSGDEETIREMEISTLVNTTEIKVITGHQVLFQIGLQKNTEKTFLIE